MKPFECLLQLFEPPPLMRVRFFGFAGYKPVVVYNRRGTRFIWITWRLTTSVRRSRRISTKTWKRRGLFRLLTVRTKKVSNVASFLLDCSGYSPIPGHTIGVSRRRRRGIRRFGAKDTAGRSQQALASNKSMILIYLLLIFRCCFFLDKTAFLFFFNHNICCG